MLMDVNKRNTTKLLHKVELRIKLLKSRREKGVIGKGWFKEIEFLSSLKEDLRKAKWDLEIEEKDENRIYDNLIKKYRVEEKDINDAVKKLMKEVVKLSNFDVMLAITDLLTYGDIKE